MKTHKGYFFTASTFKLIALSFFTLGFYQFYWSYKNWVLIKARTGQNIWPFWRAVFFPFWAYFCFKHIKTSALANNIQTSLPIAFLAVVYLILWLTLWMGIETNAFDFLFGTIHYFVFIGLLIPINNLALRVNKHLVSDFVNNSRLSIWNGAGLALVCMLSLLSLWGGISKELDHLMKIGTDYYAQGKDSKALESYHKALTISKRIEGESYFKTMALYNMIGNVYNKQGNYQKSRFYYHKALEASEKIWGKTSLKIATSYSKMAFNYQNEQDYPKALFYAQKSLKIHEEKEGKEHLHTATSYSKIGDIFTLKHDYSKALQYHRTALAIRKKQAGESHPDTAISHSSIGDVYQSQGDYASALASYQQALAIRKQTLGDKAPEVAESYRKIGSIYHNQEKNQQALLAYQQALSINEINKNYPMMAVNHETLGVFYTNQQDYPQALSHYEKGLAINEKKLGMDNYKAATYLHISFMYQKKDDNPTALSYAKKALIINQNIFGKEHPSIAYACSSIGNIYKAQGDYLSALDFYKQALEIRKKVFGNEDPETALSYMDIGYLYDDQNDFKNALFYHQQALAIHKKLYGDEHHLTAISYQNVGLLYQNLGNRQQALSSYQRALVIKEKIFGKEHINIASSYFAIGSLYLQQRDQQAIVYAQKALAIYKKTSEKEALQIINTYILIATSYYLQGKKGYPQAYLYAKQGFDVFLRQRQHRFSALNPQQKQDYLQKNNTIIGTFFTTATEYIFLLLEQDQPHKLEQIKQTTFNAWLAFKGSILASENRLIRFAQNTQDSNIQQHYQQLIQLKQAYAKLAQFTPETANERRQLNNITGKKLEAFILEANKARFAHKIKLQQLAKKIDQLRETITQNDPRFKQELALESVTGKSIMKKLSPKMVYLDYGKINNRYHLFIVTNNMLKYQISGVDISKKIDQELTAFREQIKVIEEDGVSSTNTSQHILARLHTLLFPKDMMQLFANKPKLIISPDADLRLLPFEALYDAEAKQYLIEKKSIQYIASGQEFMRALNDQSKPPITTTPQAVVFSNPNFNQATPIAKTSVDPAMNKSRALRDSFSHLAFQFEPVAELSGTATEAQHIQRVLSKTMQIQVWDREQASEANLMKTHHATIMHFATHGFFNANNPNPMLQSGILLAGANNSVKNHHDEGIISALKLSGLDLKGTDLVVLSACETGVVDPKATEGVSGLTKAFMQAGAKKVLMTLWKVDDQKTADLMGDFYKTSQDQTNQYVAALRQSKIAMIKSGLHPYYWAGFVLNGL